MKRSWTRPKVIVLARRSNPEDVLIICKTGGASGPTDGYAACEVGDNNCVDCSATADS